jgi:hypothetical protein
MKPRHDSIMCMHLQVRILRSRPDDDEAGHTISHPVLNERRHLGRELNEHMNCSFAWVHVTGFCPNFTHLLSVPYCIRLPAHMTMSEEMTCLRGIQNMDGKKNPADGPDAINYTLRKSHSYTKVSYTQLCDVDRRRSNCCVHLYEDDGKPTLAVVTEA